MNMTTSLSASKNDGQTISGMRSTEHIETLIMAGIITHRIKSAEALDPMFAVSKLHDLPEVKFVAAFQEGQIFLGCPDGPPQKLDGMVEKVPPIVSTEGAPAGVAEKIDVLIDSVDALHSETEDRIAAGLKRIDSVSHRLEFIADALEPDRSSEGSSDGSSNLDLVSLKDAIDKLDQKIAPQPTLVDALSRIETAVAGIAQAEGSGENGPETTLNGIMSAIETLTGQVSKIEQGHRTAQAERNSDQILRDLQGQFSTVAETLVKLEEGLGGIGSEASPDDPSLTSISHMIEQLNQQIATALLQDDAPQIDAISSEIRELKDVITTNAPDLEPLNAVITDLQNGISGAAADNVAATLEAIATTRSELEGTIEAKAQQSLDAIAALSEATSPELLQNVAAKVDELAETAAADSVQESVAEISGAIEKINETVNNPRTPDILEELRADVERLANQPKPVVDLTEQRRSFASFTTAFNAIAQKLDASAKHIEDQVSKPDEAVTSEQLIERLDALPSKLLDVVPSPVDLSVLEGKVDDLHRHAHGSDAPHVALTSRLDALVDVAKAEIEAMKAQVATAFERFETTKNQPIDLEPLISRIDSLTAETYALPEVVESLRTEVLSAAAKPPPQLDLSAQRESFTKFGLAIGTVVARLEETVEGLSSLQTTAQADTIELKSVMQALPVILQEALAEKFQDDPMRQGVAKLREHLTSVPEQLAQLATMQQSLDALAKRPQPALDLTEQRRGFARFATAISMVVNRLEQVATELSETKVVEHSLPEAVSLEESMRDISAGLNRLAEAQAEHIAVLDQKLIASQASADTNLSDGSMPLSVPEGSISLDEMRFLFAEMIATQIRMNKEGHEKP